METALYGGIVESVRVGVCRFALSTGGECQQRALCHALGHEGGDEDVALGECAVAVERNRVDMQQLRQRSHAAAHDGGVTQTAFDAQCNEQA